MRRYSLGVDTSNYCTSICLITESGDIVAEEREWLPVALGEKGMRQSDGVFHHVKQLADLWCAMPLQKDMEISAVCASVAPRPAEGSYMPVFTVGTHWGRSLAHAYQVPFYQTTHQEGHIAAALRTSDCRVQPDTFTVMHLSGGTSDMLYVHRTEAGYTIKTVGGSRDLYAGQLVDRIGVAMGLSFPSGMELERLAKNAKGRFPLPFTTAVDGPWFSLSGPETALKRYVDDEAYAPVDIARTVENVVAKTVEKALLNAFNMGLPKHVLLVGGVAANQYIRKRLRKRLEHRAVGARLSFAAQRYSGDNAYGVALIGLTKLKQGAGYDDSDDY